MLFCIWWYIWDRIREWRKHSLLRFMSGRNWPIKWTMSHQYGWYGMIEHDMCCCSWENVTFFRFSFLRWIQFPSHQLVFFPQLLSVCVLAILLDSLWRNQLGYPAPPRLMSPSVRLSVLWKHVDFYHRRNKNEGIHVESFVCCLSPPNIYSYVQEKNLGSTRKFVENYLLFACITNQILALHLQNVDGLEEPF